MGFLDAFLGKRKVAAPAATDRLFALTTAYVDLETAQGIKTRGGAGIVFQQLATADFAQILADTEELLAGTGEETGSTVETKDDEFGYKWVIVRDDDMDDLVVSVNTVADNLSLGGYGDRILAAVFSFSDAQGKPLYLIYNYKRGNWYPFVPAPGQQQRSNEREFQLKAQLRAGLPFEEDVARWFPLWGIPI
ncbi:MAG: hypothetical protein ABIO51_01365 [Solirubrobacteraceae bacterium]